MAAKKPSIKNKQLVLPIHQQPEYKSLLAEIKQRLRASQLRAVIAVNQQLLLFYWEVGTLILEKQKTAKWGDKLLQALEKDLRASFPDTEGFSRTNLKYMKRFAETYPDFKIGQALPDQLTWSHHIVLLSHVKEQVVREWYMKEAIINGWGYRHLLSEIKNNLYTRKGKNSIKTSNYMITLAEPQSTLAHEALKEPYKFHFLTVGNDAHEREVERGLIAHITQFMLELGQGVRHEVASRVVSV